MPSGAAENNEMDVKAEDGFRPAIQTEGVFLSDVIDPVYQAKAKILNDAMQEIGMGRYQWGLFFVTGFGCWGSVSALILTSVVNEFGFNGPFLTLSQSIGLLIGSIFCGFASDVWGRKFAFNVSLFLYAISTLVAGASPNSVTICALAAVWSLGAGGSPPVDAAILLEFLPASHQYLLTVAAIWGPLYSVIESLIAWPLISNFSCALVASAERCPRSTNQGWRYLLFISGGVLVIFWGLRFFIFKLRESPKYLMGRGQDADAVAVIHWVAKYNGTQSSLTLEDLTRVGSLAIPGDSVILNAHERGPVLRKVARFHAGHVKGLFATKKLAYSTSLLITLSTLVGLAAPLYTSYVPYYLATRGAYFGDGTLYTTYRNQVLLSVIGIPGCLLAGWMVELPKLGRRGTLALSTSLTGVFILASTTSRSSNALLGWNCAYSLSINAMISVFHGISPELFLTKDRGTGIAIAGAAARSAGILAPMIALYANITTSAPIFIAGAMLLAAGFIGLLLPFETRGHASL